MKMKFKALLIVLIMSISLISLASFAEAALSSKYEAPASGADAAAPSKPTPATKAAPAAKTVPAAAVKTAPANLPQNVAAPSVNGASVVYRGNLTAKQLELIKKEHAVYCKAFVDAEMGLRYFYKTQYDAQYRGAKAPTQEELEAMRFELSLLMKDLGSSAKRYASNIRMAKIAMTEMDEGERTLFAIALSHIMATPAYAVDAGSLSGVEAGLNSIANATAAVGLSAEANFATAEANIAKAGGVLSAATSLATTLAITGVSLVGGFALASAATTTGAAVIGGLIVTGAIVGGGLEIVDSTLGFIDSLTENTTDTKDLQKISATVNLVNVVAGAKKGELIRVVVQGADATKQLWIPEIFAETEKKDCPGKDGVNKVKNAQKAASSGGRGGGGGGGGGGGCGGGC
jgi:uncharacterized membrane protein YgcG